MAWINKTNGKRYSFGGLKTEKGVIFNPTAEVLRANGYEPYTPPAVEAEPIPAEEHRRKAYVAECDPLLIASLGYAAEGNEAAAAECRAQYLAKKAEIRTRIPDDFPSV